MTMSPSTMKFHEILAHQIPKCKLFRNSTNSFRLSYRNSSFSQALCAEQAESLSFKHGRDVESALFKNIEPKIGLEVHAQLKLSSKLFSQGGNSAHAPSNSQLDLFDVSLPGTLPKLNQGALKAAILTGLGLNCNIRDRIHFDRKNYFYADMPAGFQITQYHNPIAEGGYIDFIVATYHDSVVAHSQRYDVIKYLYPENRSMAREVCPYIKRSHIERIQLEQDSAKTLNQSSETSDHDSLNLVDYNRSGAALIEIVFRPDLTNHHEASSLIRELVLFLKYLGTCDCELQEGSLRVDANVSIDKLDGHQTVNSARVELKNLNSLRSLNKAILHEVLRQAQVIRAGGSVIQETRTFNTRTSETKVLRLKEDSIDYRYVPEPSIPPFEISTQLIESTRKELPKKLPFKKSKEILEKYNLDMELVVEISEEPGMSDFVDQVLSGRLGDEANTVADFLIYTLSNLRSIAISPIQVNLDGNSEFMKRLGPSVMRKIVDLFMTEKISFATAYEVTKIIFMNNSRKEPIKIVEEMGWFQINDPKEVEKFCLEAASKMKTISKKFVKTGSKKSLYLMLCKIAEVSDNKISIKVAIERLNSNLRPNRDAD